MKARRAAPLIGSALLVAVGAQFAAPEVALATACNVPGDYATPEDAMDVGCTALTIVCGGTCNFSNSGSGYFISSGNVSWSISGGGVVTLGAPMDPALIIEATMIIEKDHSTELIISGAVSPAIVVQNGGYLELTTDFSNVTEGEQLNTTINLINVTSNLNTAIEVIDSELTMIGVSVTNSDLGLHVHGTTQNAHVEAATTYFSRNDLAVKLEGGGATCSGPNQLPAQALPAGAPQVTFGLADQSVQPNWFVDNNDVFRVEGSAVLDVSHAILVKNLARSPTAASALLVLSDSSQVALTNIVAFGNDSTTLALESPRPTVPPVANNLIDHNSCGVLRLVGSTLANNSAENAVHLSSTHSKVIFEASVVYDSAAAKGFSCSNINCSLPGSCPAKTGYVVSNSISTVYASGLSQYDGCTNKPGGQWIPGTHTAISPVIDFTHSLPANSTFPAIPQYLVPSATVALSEAAVEGFTYPGVVYQDYSPLVASDSIDHVSGTLFEGWHVGGFVEDISGDSLPDGAYTWGYHSPCVEYDAYPTCLP